MAMIDPRRIGAILFLLASPGAAQKPQDLTALLTQIEGEVTLSSASRAEFRLVRRAAQRQIIRRGEVVHVPAGARVTVICSTDQVVSLTRPQDWILDATTCGLGAPLPPSSYQNLASDAGRLLPRNGVLLAEFETRYVNPRLGPFLLSPLDTVVTDARPRLVWTQVPDAVEYEIEIRGAAGTSIRLAADDLHCGHGSGPWHDLDVCSWVPSGKWPALEPGKPVFLKFGSRQAVTAPLRHAQEVYQIHLLSGNDQHRLQDSLRQIATLPVDKANRLLLAAGAYAQSGLYAEALANYDEALQAQEIPEARVTLGDLYLTVGLTALADREYRQVQAGAPALAAQAAAELGLGQVAYARKLFGEARAHFERARQLYTSAGLSAAAENAQAAAARLSGNGSP
ncbi:MAG TPA: tetratricopeptide repeat protein [Thermoanaerobaculia bacterium]|nr:tetratricopeptide repeat protein [Thermoanaerobaculia bacterium]